MVDPLSTCWSDFPRPQPATVWVCDEQFGKLSRCPLPQSHLQTNSYLQFRLFELEALSVDVIIYLGFGLYLPSRYLLSHFFAFVLTGVSLAFSGTSSALPCWVGNLHCDTHTRWLNNQVLSVLILESTQGSWLLQHLGFGVVGSSALAFFDFVIYVSCACAKGPSGTGRAGQSNQIASVY